jgi:hypothetical protein
MVITIGVVAYAWVTFATVNSIDGIGLTASAGDDLKVSIDGVNYYNSLPSDVIQDLIGEVNLYDVTTTDNINFTRGGLNNNTQAVENLHYLSFDLWFQTTRSESNIYLYNNVNEKVDFYNHTQGTFVVSRGVYWMSPVSFYNGPSQSDLVSIGSIDRYYSADAIRIGIRELVDDTNPLDNRDPNNLANLIYDPQEDPFRGYGVPYGSYSFFFQRARQFLYIPTIKPNTVYQLTELDPNNPYRALNNDSLIATMQPTNLTDIEGKAIYRSKVRVNIWIEGWDADAFDAIDKDTVKIQFQFKLANYDL